MYFIRNIFLKHMLISVLLFSQGYGGFFPSLPLEMRQQHIDKVNAEIHKRWQKVKKLKKNFVLYALKTHDQLKEEFNQLQSFREKLWYQDPASSPHICQPDYAVAQDLLEKGYYRGIYSLPFAFNSTDGSYNASTILIEDRFFLALQEPRPDLVPQFFKLLINHGAQALVRLKPESEFSDAYSIKYWMDQVSTKGEVAVLKLSLLHSGKTFDPIYIPYFHTEKWVDDEALDLQELYTLVQQVRHACPITKNPKAPIACHCASGVGRTGAFIAAVTIADFLESNAHQRLSVEEIVLKLSIQRPHFVSTWTQYKMLYDFVAYYKSKTKEAKY